MNFFNIFAKPQPPAHSVEVTEPIAQTLLDENLSQRAYEHIRHLVQDIGARPAGSPAEAQTLEYISEQMQAWGYRVEKQPVSFAPTPRFYLPYLLAGALVALGGWLIPFAPYAVLLLPLLFYVLPAYTRWEVRNRPRTSQSANLYATPLALGNTPPRLILSAHVDSARVTPLRNRRLLEFKYQTLFVVQRIANILGVAALLQIMDIPLGAGVVGGLGVAGTIIGVWLMITQAYDQFFHQNRFSPGAHDNASGVGALLALAEHYSANPGAPAFLFTGAEETGMHGAEAFAEAFPMSEDKPAVLCLDMVGAGHILYYIQSDGTLFRQTATPQLISLLQKVYPSVRGLAYTLRSGDFAVFLRHGFPATALQTGGSLSAEIAYHTVLDTLDLIDTSTLQSVIQTVGDFQNLYLSETSKTAALPYPEAQD